MIRILILFSYSQWSESTGEIKGEILISRDRRLYIDEVKL